MSKGTPIVLVIDLVLVLVLVLVLASAMGCTYVQNFQLPADGGGCTAGRCAPVLLASGQGDATYVVPYFPYYATDAGEPLQGPDRIAVDDTHVYWLNLRGEVMRVPVSGGTAQRVASTKPQPAWIGLDQQFVYFSTLGAEIFRVAKEGGTPVLLVPARAGKPGVSLLPGDPYPLEFKIASDELQWADGSGVYSCPVAGCAGAPTTLDAGSTLFLPFSFATDASGKMYVSEEDHDLTSMSTISYAMTVLRDGQWVGAAGPTAYYELLGGVGEVYALAATDFGPNGVVRWSESSVTFLASGDTVPRSTRGLAQDDRYLYWPNAAADQSDPQKRTASVVRCAKTGCSSPEVLADAQQAPRAVAVSKDAVYWTTGDGNVMKLARP